MLYVPRPYQLKAIDRAFFQTNKVQSTLIISPTGTGKTIIFAGMAEMINELPGKVLILVDREVLAEQAMDKIEKSTGIECSLEKSKSCSLAKYEHLKNVTIGSVQSLTIDRLEKFDKDRFDYIIVDEAHKSVTPSYMVVFEYFPYAKRIGVTATNYRLDAKAIVGEGGVYETIAFEYLLPEAIDDGWLVPLKVMMLPVEIDYTKGKKLPSQKAEADISNKRVASTLDPYLESIVKKLAKLLVNKKTVMFLPLVETSKKVKAMFHEFAPELNVYEVNCNSDKKKEDLDTFENAGAGSIMLNAMLLTTGWDCESLDTVVNLRATTSWSLAMQIWGRGTRPYVDQKIYNSLPTKEERKKLIADSSKPHLLIIDFLYKMNNMSIVRPPAMLMDNNIDDVSYESTMEVLNQSSGFEKELDLSEVVADGENKAVIVRENALAKRLEKLALKKKTMLNNVELFSDFNEEINAELSVDVSDVNVNFIKENLFNNGVNANSFENINEMVAMNEVINKRNDDGLSSARQLKTLNRYGFTDVKFWSYDQAQKIVRSIAMQGWGKNSLPKWIGDPKKYTP